MCMKIKWCCENVIFNDVFDNFDNWFVFRLVVWIYFY